MNDANVNRLAEALHSRIYSEGGDVLRRVAKVLLYWDYYEGTSGAFPADISASLVVADLLGDDSGAVNAYRRECVETFGE